MPLTDPRSTARRVTVPTTMLWSDGDTFVGRGGVERCAEWVDAPYELVVLDGLDHWLPTHAPDLVADAVLARLRAAG